MNALADDFERHADVLVATGRSPLYIVLMRGAARNARAGGVVNEAFPEGPGPPGSVPELRLMAALHYLALGGDAPELARHFPSASGEESPDEAWAVAEAIIGDRLRKVRELCARTVQTNEPGRSVALYGGLLWLASRYSMPIQLLEVGASAGLNLNADRYRYLVDGRCVGNRDSAVTFVEPWRGLPVPDPWSAQRKLSIQTRRGRDPNPIDVSTEDGARRLLSYIWPDEPDRLARLRAAIDIARSHPPSLDVDDAAHWLGRRLTEDRAGTLTVVWQSVMYQYLDRIRQRELQDVIRQAGHSATSRQPLAWLTMESASEDHLSNFTLSCHIWPGDRPLTLADADSHGPPVSWRPPNTS